MQRKTFVKSSERPEDMKGTYFMPRFKGKIISIFYWDDQEPPKKRFWVLNNERFCYLECMIRIGRIQTYTRIWYSRAIPGIYEILRRKVWLAKQYVREMRLRKTLFVTREQIRWRLTAEAIGCITTKVE